MAIHSHMAPRAEASLALYSKWVATGRACAMHRCGPFHTKPGVPPHQLFGALANFFVALERLIDTVGQGPQRCPVGPKPFQPLPGLDFFDGIFDIPDCPPKMDPIAGKGRIWGDPHFIGADGGKYDVQGRAGGIYNLLSDKGFQMNGRFDAWGSGGATVVGEVGIVANGNRITVEKDGDVMVNGRALKNGQCVTLWDGTRVSKKSGKVDIKSAEWDVSISTHGKGSRAYLNIDVSTDNAVADGVKPHGLLGQTFDGDGKARNGDKGRGAQGGGAIETLSGDFTKRGDKTTVGNYEVDSLHDIDGGSFDRYDGKTSDYGGVSDRQAQMLKATERMQNQAMATQAAVGILTTLFNATVETSKSARNAANKIAG